MRGVIVVMRPVLGFDVDVEEHVVDEAVEIDELRHGLIGGFIGDARIDQSQDRVPVVGIPVGGFSVVRRGVGAHQHVPVSFLAAEMPGGKARVEPFAGIVETPVKSVDVEVNPVAAARQPAHVAVRSLGPHVAQIGRGLGPVAQTDEATAAGNHARVRIARGPAIDKTGGAQNDVVELLHLAGEPVVAQFRRAVFAFEQQSERMLGRALIKPTGIALHTHAAIHGEGSRPIRSFGQNQFRAGGPLPISSQVEIVGVGGVVVDAPRRTPQAVKLGDDGQHRN